MSAPNDGGPAFPCHTNPSPGKLANAPQGMTLRDWFARTTPHDETCEMTYKHLSRQAQERLAGMGCPEIDRDLRGGSVVDQQIALMAFHAKVTAALRYISADAMLAAREKKSPVEDSAEPDLLAALKAFATGKENS